MRTFYDEVGSDGGDNGTNDTNDTGAGEATQLPEGAFLSAKWREALPEDIRSHASLAKITSIEDLGRGYVHTQGLIGKDPSRVMEQPDVDDAVAVRELQTKMGLPAEAKDYKVMAPEGSPDWLSPGEPLGQAYLKAAHVAGLLPGQAASVYKELAGFLGDTAKEQATAGADRAETNVRDLKAKWGEKYDQNVAASNLAIDKFGGKELRDKLDAAALGGDPHVMSLLSAFGATLAEDGGQGGGGGGFGDAMDPDQLRSQAKEFLSDAQKEGVSVTERKRLNEKAAVLFARLTKKVITSE